MAVFEGYPLLSYGHRRRPFCRDQTIAPAPDNLRDLALPPGNLPAGTNIMRYATPDSDGILNRELKTANPDKRIDPAGLRHRCA